MHDLGMHTYMRTMTSPAPMQGVPVLCLVLCHKAEGGLQCAGSGTVTAAGAPPPGHAARSRRWPAHPNPHGWLARLTESTALHTVLESFHDNDLIQLCLRGFFQHTALCICMHGDPQG